MRPKLHICIGLPASGKTTLAKQMLADQKVGCRVNRDDLRSMMWGANKWSKRQEKLTIEARNNLIVSALSNGVDVICDDTNLSERVRETLIQLAVAQNADIVFHDLRHVDLDTCISRNRKRPNPVPEHVIIGMWETHLSGVALGKADSPDETLPSAYIFDLDGTLCDNTHRSPYDYTQVIQDKPLTAVTGLLQRLHDDGHVIIFMSGREDVCVEDTTRWLESNTNVAAYKLFMRAAKDNRKDSVVKKELYDTNVRDYYNVLGVFDDREQVVRMWRHDLGLTVFQVADGRF